MVCIVANCALNTAFYDLLHSAQLYSKDPSTNAPNFHTWVRLNLIQWITGFTCYWAIKATFLILFRMLFGVSRRFMKAWWAVTAFVFLTYVGTIAGALVQCGGSVSHLFDIGKTFDASIEADSLGFRRLLLSVISQVAARHFYLHQCVQHRLRHHKCVPDSLQVTSIIP